MRKTVHAACPHDCPDACGVLITVDDERAVKIQGDPAHPVTRGFLCAKVAKYLDRVYSPDRVLYPMRRKKGVAKGPAGESPASAQPFERITWDEALDEICSRFRAVTAEFGSEAILPYSYGGTLGALGNASMDRRFFHRLGASRLDRTICSEAGGVALTTVVGRKLGTEPEQFRHSKLIIAWGANIHGNNVHLWPFIEEARRAGGKLVVIDPYKTRTARCADWYLPIHPGTDVALALGMMHVIIGDDLYDHDFVERYTLGFPELSQRVREYTPQRVAAWTGIAATDIVKLAREYATVRPAAIRLNYGVQRCENGGMNVRAITMLPCITGSWKEVGGGLQLSTSKGFALDEQALERPDLIEKSGLDHAPRVVNMTSLASALNVVDDPPVKALFVWNSNPAAIAPDHNNVVRGLMRPDLFTVVHEQFMTDTTDYADIVLPATTFFEHKDLVRAYGHYFIQISNAAIEPLGECRSNVDVFRTLAERMGFTEECFQESPDEMIDAALRGANDDRRAWLDGITRERLEREGHVRLNLPSHIGVAETRSQSNVQEFGGSVDRAYVAVAGSTQSCAVAAAESTVGSDVERPTANDLRPTTNDLSAIRQFGGYFLPFANGFATSSGKAELYSAGLAAQGLDPIASFIPPTESRHTEAARRFPLEMLSRKADNFLNSSFCNIESLQPMEETGLIEITHDDATPRGIADGDRVRVFNDRGSITLTARVNGAVSKGVVATRLNWAKLAPERRNVNALTSDRLTDMGGGPTFYSCLVEVEKY
jgi:anaerobic selenocysteine-containing dehydrogenase